MIALRIRDGQRDRSGEKWSIYFEDCILKVEQIR